MCTYIIKRILLIIPTFFAIVLLTFLVLNFAPGRPGQTQVSADGSQQAESSEARESYRIFKEQFNFDKPVLLNTRFGLGKQDVMKHLTTLADFQRPPCGDGESPAPDGCIAPANKPESAVVIEASEKLEDWGEYSVTPLMEVARDESTRLDVRRLAVNTLSQNARVRFKNQYGTNISREDRDHNDKAQKENEMTRSWSLEVGVDHAAIDVIMKESWEPWSAEREETYTYSGGERIGIFFFDTRFSKYLGNVLLLDFGVSHVDKKPVLGTIFSKLKYSISLSLLSVLLAYFISVPLGVWSAYYRDTTADNVVTVLLFMLYSLPSFFVAVVLLKYFTIGEPFEWFPTGGFIGEGSENMTAWQQLQSIMYHLTLPILCLTYRSLASLSRYARTGVLDVIRADYIRTARAKGLSEPMVVVKHAVRNGMIPILTLLGTLLPVLIGGSVIIEVIFNIPGMGLYLFESITARDYNSIMAVLLISTVLTLVGLLVSDISYAVVDPRISFD